jgi:hypothetical protein
MSSAQRDCLIEAMRCFDKEKDLDRDWDWYVDTHKQYGEHDHETMPHVPGSGDHIHIHSPYYWLPWHRLFLLNFESRLRRYDADVALPYWRFTVQREIPDMLRKKLFGWMGVSRAISHNPDRLPSVEDMQAVRNAASYADFDAGLSALHAEAHNWVGGDWGAMSNPNKSPKDPLFYLLHAYIDMIWADWQARNPDLDFPEAYLDMELVPWDKKVRDVLDIKTLGYGYA